MLSKKTRLAVCDSSVVAAWYSILIIFSPLFSLIKYHARIPCVSARWSFSCMLYTGA